MSYEYKHAIKYDLKHLHENMPPTGSWKHEQKLNELDEVYAKAKLLDNIFKVLENHDNKDGDLLAEVAKAHIDFSKL